MHILISTQLHLHAQGMQKIHVCSHHQKHGPGTGATFKKLTTKESTNYYICLMHVQWIVCFFLLASMCMCRFALYMLKGSLFFLVSLLVGQCMCMYGTQFQSHQLHMLLCQTLAICCYIYYSTQKQTSRLYLLILNLLYCINTPIYNQVIIMP